MRPLCGVVAATQRKFTFAEYIALGGMRCKGPLPLPDRCGGDGCDYCGVRCGPGDCGPDSYASDLVGDDTPVLKCRACRHESAMDI